MGTDINGWVEIRNYDKWYGVIYIRNLLFRNTDAFSCLFGVSNSAGFKPIAANRDIPKDASDEVYNDEWLLESHSHTWISLTEINAIDWDEYAEWLDKRVTKYRKDENGNWKLYGKSWLPNPPPINVFTEGRKQVADTLYEVKRMQRREVLSYWSTLFELMNILGKVRGEDKVRLVVYFDS